MMLGKPRQTLKSLIANLRVRSTPIWVFPASSPNFAVATDFVLIFCFIYLDTINNDHKMFIVPSNKVKEYCKWEYKKWLHAERKGEVKPTPSRTFRIPSTKPSKYEDDFSLFE